MKMNKLAIILYLGGIVFLALAAKTWRENRSLLNPYIKVNEQFDINSFLDSSDYSHRGDKFELKPDHITVLYLLTSADCSPCYNEVISFNYYFQKYGFEEKDIQQLVIVIDPNKKQINRFVKTTEFITPVLYGHDKKFANILQSYDNLKDYRQIILFDNNSRSVFFRAHLTKGEMTSDSHKVDILSEAKRALQSISSR
jgi:hypothetical protein